MSQPDLKENTNPAKTMVPSGKTAVASPKLSADEHVEMSDLPLSTAPEDDDIMQLARLGDIVGVQRLFDSGKFDAQHSDDEGITPLHVFISCPIVLWSSADSPRSGLRLITSMPCASFS